MSNQAFAMPQTEPAEQLTNPDGSSAFWFWVILAIGILILVIIIIAVIVYMSRRPREEKQLEYVPMEIPTRRSTIPAELQSRVRKW